MSKQKKHSKKDIRQQVNEFYGVSFKIDIDWENLRLDVSSEGVKMEREEENAKEEVLPEPKPVNEKPAEPWIPDEATYHEVQKLIGFVDLVGGLPETPEESRANTRAVNQILQNIDQPEKRKNFFVRLDIVDWELQLENSGQGVYRKQWWLYFEQGRMTLEIETYGNGEELEYWGSECDYFGMIYFNETDDGRNVDLDEGIDRFVDDAKNFRTYMTDKLNGVETEIEV